MWRWGAGALAAFVCGHAAPLQAAEFKVETQDGKTRLLLTGKIMSGDAGKFAAAVRNAKNKGNAVTVVVLNSPGGSGPDSISIAKAVRAAKMTTSVPAGAVCASGCFVVFAGGTERTAEPTSRMGVHAAGINGRETEGSRKHTLEIARILKSFDVPSHITDKLIRTPHKDIYALSGDELRSGMNVTIGGKAAATAATEIAVALARFPPSFREAATALERGDPATAIRVIRPFAEGGERFAQVLMGIAHERLKPPDNAAVIKWYRLAADQGDSGSQHYLGRLYESGRRGLPRDRAEAFKWFTLANIRGNKEAPESVSRLEKLMTADELADGRKRVFEWRQTTPAKATASWPAQSSQMPAAYSASPSLVKTYGSAPGAPASASPPPQPAPPLALPTVTGEFATQMQARILAARHNLGETMKAWNSCLALAASNASDSNATPEAIAEASYSRCKPEEARAHQEAVDASPAGGDEAVTRRWKDEVDKQLWPAIKRVRLEKVVATIRDDHRKLRLFTGKQEGGTPSRRPMEAGIP